MSEEGQRGQGRWRGGKRRQGHWRSKQRQGPEERSVDWKAAPLKEGAAYGW